MGKGTADPCGAREGAGSAGASSQSTRSHAAVGVFSSVCRMSLAALRVRLASSTANAFSSPIFVKGGFQVSRLAAATSSSPSCNVFCGKVKLNWIRRRALKYLSAATMAFTLTGGFGFGECSLR